MAKPYYQDDYITIYNNDCLEILPTLDGVRSIVSDPPYGKNIVKNGNIGGENILLAGVYFPIEGDEAPFDPAHLLRFQNVILWGANYYANKLPPMSSWLIWDKKEGGNSDDFADVEMAWSNSNSPARLYHHLWRGRIKKGSDRLLRRQHPTQKPVTLMRWCIERIKEPGLICDPYAGSGSTLVAAKQLGLKAIGIELVEDYCKIAAARCANTSPMFPAMQAIAETPEQLELIA